MDTHAGGSQSRGLGFGTTAGALAGVAGLVLTVAVTATLLIGATLGAGSTGLGGGYEDYGQRHRADYSAQSVRTVGQLDDYGIRCLVVGWCSMPAGVPQPAGISATR